MKLRTSLLLLILAVLSACGSKEQVDLNPGRPRISPKTDQQAVVKKPVIPRYVYTGYKYRDPFVALNTKSAMLKGLNEVPVPNIDSLVLKGIMDDGRQKIAMLAGGGYSYILKDGCLYDNRRRLVNGISGNIKKDSVVIIDAYKKVKEIKMKDK